MNKRNIVLLFILASFPLLLWGQRPAYHKSKPKKEDLVFTKPLKKQTRFNQKYIGRLNGRAMELGFIEKIVSNQLVLTVVLTELDKKKVYLGNVNTDKSSSQLKDIKLSNQYGEIINIHTLYLHNYNPNFINLITKNGSVGCFAWGMSKPLASNCPAKKYTSLVDFKGYYEGRIDGRPAELKIETRRTGILFQLYDREHKVRYWTFLTSWPEENINTNENQQAHPTILSFDLPTGQNSFSLSNIELRSTTDAKKITISNLVLDHNTNQIISGDFISRKKAVGLFFIRKLPDESSLIAEFPWPPPTASDMVKIPDDLLTNTDSLGGVNQLIINSLDKSGYRFKPNKYFYTPNGFALVTELEKVDCEARPLEGNDRWNVNPSEFEKNFTLLDYLRSLVFKEEGLYRLFVFLVTDDLNPSKSIEPTLEETQGWVVSGSARLPQSIASIPLNDHHYFRAYVYEFSKVAGQIQATMVKKGQQSCWRSGETHLKHTKILDNLIIRP